MDQSARHVRVPGESGIPSTDLSPTDHTRDPAQRNVEAEVGAAADGNVEDRPSAPVPLKDGGTVPPGWVLGKGQHETEASVAAGPYGYVRSAKSPGYCDP